ncbi:hypothetical protein QYE76_003289 [Lolium multiflorum]|uniref:Uncharacterized protein n=1 Tax=Lolium multiflorum TaxID=4521 RepID=A0AAD8RPZ5_LOLMU|nr:hypothetical protein QYE76_003289 [Lolium multiflorum]
MVWPLERPHSASFRLQNSLRDETQDQNHDTPNPIDVAADPISGIQEIASKHPAERGIISVRTHAMVAPVIASNELWRIIVEGFKPYNPDKLTRREAVDGQLNNTALHMIQTAMGTKELSRVRHFTTAKDAWDGLAASCIGTTHINDSWIKEKYIECMMPFEPIDVKTLSEENAMPLSPPQQAVHEMQALKKEKTLEIHALKNALEECQETIASLEERLENLEEPQDKLNKLTKARDLARAKTKVLIKEKAKFGVDHEKLVKDLDELDKAHKALKSEYFLLSESYEQLQIRLLASYDIPSTSTPSCEHANIIEENARLKDELAKASSPQSKLSLDDLLKIDTGRVPLSNNQDQTQIATAVTVSSGDDDGDDGGDDDDGDGDDVQLDDGDDGVDFLSRRNFPGPDSLARRRALSLSCLSAREAVRIFARYPLGLRSSDEGFGEERRRKGSGAPQSPAARAWAAPPRCVAPWAPRLPLPLPSSS